MKAEIKWTRKAAGWYVATISGITVNMERVNGAWQWDTREAFSDGFRTKKEAKRSVEIFFFGE